MTKEDRLAHFKELRCHALQQASMSLFWARYDRIHKDIEGWEYNMHCARKWLIDMYDYSQRIHRLEKEVLRKNA